MKLKRAIKIGKDCGLETIGEAICNIELHASSIFDFDKVQEEIEELHNDFRNSGLNEDDLLEDFIITKMVEERIKEDNEKRYTSEDAIRRRRGVSNDRY